MTRCIVPLALSMLALAQPVHAQGPFGMDALADTVLADARGGSDAAPYSLSQGQLVRIQDSAAREQFRLIGSVSGISIDDWWANDGAALIDASAAAPIG